MKTSSSQSCYIYAHKGVIKEAADNTRSAFDKALMYSIDGIETDVQLSKDKVSVLYHNRVMDQLGYRDKHICDFNYDELKQLNFAAYFKGAKAEKVITLKEFIKDYRSQARLQIEIKHRDWEDTQSYQIKIQQCLNLIGSSENLDIIISSFNLDCLQYAHHLGTEIPLVYTFRETDSISLLKETIVKEYFISAICLPVSMLDKSLVCFLRDQNKLILAYTCNSQKEIQKALDLKIDILITDDPSKALQMRG